MVVREVSSPSESVFAIQKYSSIPVVLPFYWALFAKVAFSLLQGMVSGMPFCLSKRSEECFFMFYIIYSRVEMLKLRLK